MGRTMEFVMVVDKRDIGWVIRPTNMTCPVCGEGLVRLFEVEKSSSKYLGKLFYSCSRTGCRFFVWEDELSSSRAKVKNLVEEETDQLSQLLKTCACISNEGKVEVTVVNFRLSKRSRIDKGKEKVKE